MTTRTARRLAWSAFAVSVLFGLTAIVLNTMNTHFNIVTVIAVADILVLGFTGAVIASRQPTNRIGWIFVALGLSITYLTAAINYVQGETRPGAVLIAWLTGPIWNPVIIMAIILIPLLFPTGRLLSPRWRVVAWCAVAFIVLSTPGNAFLPGPLTKQGTIQNPFALPGAKDFLFALQQLALIPGAIALFGAIASLVVRFRRAGVPERLQLKWFIAASLFLTVGFVGNSIAAQLLPSLGPETGVFLALGLTALPVTIGIAVLRYRLYDIDVVINKSLVYGSLAAFIAAVYVAIVVGLGTLLGSHGQPNLTLSILATAIVAVAFQPVRERIERLANRLVYGLRATPYQVMARFAETASGTLAVDEVLPRIAESAAQAAAARTARVTFSFTDGGQRTAGWPDGVTPAGGLTVPISYRDQPLGELTVAKAPGEPITRAEDRLLHALASQAGLVLHNIRLAMELQDRVVEVSRQADELRASRQRLVSAEEDERRRLEQTIREGTAEDLTGIRDDLPAVAAVLPGQPEEAVHRLDSLIQRATAALDGLRHLAHGISPSDQRLRAVSQAAASRSGSNLDLEM